MEWDEYATCSSVSPTVPSSKGVNTVVGTWEYTIRAAAPWEGNGEGTVEGTPLNKRRHKSLPA